VAEDGAVGALAKARGATLAPDMHIGQIMELLDREQADELAVVDEGMQVLGTVSDSFVRRRYAQELEKAQRDLFGEK
jgi:chloride channel protein, CIC family